MSKTSNTSDNLLDIDNPKVQKILDDHSEELMPALSAEDVQSLDSYIASTPRLGHIARKLQMLHAIANRKASVELKNKKARRKANKIARQSRRHNLRHGQFGRTV